MKKNFKQLSLLLGILVTIFMLQACSSGEAEEGESETTGNSVPNVLNVGYIGTSELNLPANAIGWGIEKGIIQEELKKHGITEINLVAFPNGPDLNESLISGRIDIGNLGDTPAIVAKASGAKTRLISQPTTHNIGYLIGKKDGVKSVKDLEGKTIAVQKGSFMHRYVVGLLKKKGVKNYSLVHMLTPDAEAALARGEIDAMTNSGVRAIKQLEEGYVHLDDALSHPELIGSSVTVVSEDYLVKSPNIAKIWNEAVRKSLDDLKQHEEEYYELIAKISNSTPELVKETAPIEWLESEPFTDSGIALLEGTKEFLVKEKLAQKDFSIEEWILQ